MVITQTKQSLIEQAKLYSARSYKLLLRGLAARCISNSKLLKLISFIGIPFSISLKGFIFLVLI
jgi:hypothetical protein